MRLYEDSVLPQWLRQAEWPVIGREEDDEDDDSEEEEDESEEDEDDDSDDEDDEDEDDEDEEDEEEDDEDDPVAKSKARLKKLRREHEEERSRLNGALRKERQERRKLAKEIKDLKKLVPAGKGGKPKGGSDKTEDEIKAEQEQEQKSVKLAQRLQKQAVDNVIIRLAPQFKFADADDVVKLIDRDLIDVDQDDDDPADVEVDVVSVKDAMKQLAKTKKHLLVTSKPGANGKTGSKMGGKKKKDELSDEILRNRYPALGPARK